MSYLLSEDKIYLENYIFVWLGEVDAPVLMMPDNIYCISAENIILKNKKILAGKFST